MINNEKSMIFHRFYVGIVNPLVILAKGAASMFLTRYTQPLT